MKKSIQLFTLINKDIKVGDKVKFTDGSSLSLKGHNDLSYYKNNELYIIYAYPEITGVSDILKEIEGTVIETGITNVVCLSDEWCYLQDCVIQLGKAQFRTASKHVIKVTY